MTATNIYFDENKFIEIILDRYYNENNQEDHYQILDNYFSWRFPTNEICEAICIKYYPNECNNSLYSILSFKLDCIIIDNDDSDADTEEIDEDIEERQIYLF
jgi:hypothetical protein